VTRETDLRTLIATKRTWTASSPDRGSGPAAQSTPGARRQQNSRPPADQRWTLARVSDLIARLFHTRYALPGTPSTPTSAPRCAS
jgi:hypothetical protein